MENRKIYFILYIKYSPREKKVHRKENIAESREKQKKIYKGGASLLREFILAEEIEKCIGGSSTISRGSCLSVYRIAMQREEKRNIADSAAGRGNQN